MLKSLTSNGVIFAVTYILHIGCSRVCLHILFARIQPSVQCVANSSFAFWNVLVFFNSNICNPWLVEGNDVITKDTEGQLHGSKGHSPMGSGPYMGSWSVIPMLCHPHLHYVPATLPSLQTYDPVSSLQPLYQLPSGLECFPLFA